jgi:hypothetical protein
LKPEFVGMTWVIIAMRCATRRRPRPRPRSLPSLMLGPHYYYYYCYDCCYYYRKWLVFRIGKQPWMVRFS